MRNLVIALAGATLLLGCAAHAQETVAPNAQLNPAPAAAAPSTRVMMLRVNVSHIDRAIAFYREVFGATVMQQMGGNVRITTLPGGLPGIILIQSEQEANMNGSWVIQVSDLQATLARAAAHGGTLMNTHFEGQPSGRASQSSHIVDPDGNIIELLQMGGAR